MSEKPKSRARWKPVAILAIVLTVGVVATCLSLRNAQERTTFFGAIDPMTGYRCRITLSSGWKQEPAEADNPSFVAPPLSPIRKWIDRYLLHQPVTEPASINLSGGSLANFTLREGYPERSMRTGEHLRTQRRFHIHDYPATLVELDNGEYLFVYVPAAATVYRVAGVSGASGTDRLQREMQGVIASFQVEKVPVSAIDLEVIEAALSDWQSLNGLEHGKSGDDQIVVYNQCLEDFKPHNRKIILSDMKAYTAEIDKAWAAPNRSIFDDANTLDRPILRKFFPHAFGYVYVGRPTYPDNDTAILELTVGPGEHGDGTSIYTLKRKKGKWNIIKRDGSYPA